MSKPYDPQDAEFLAAINARWPSKEASAFLELARSYTVLADSGCLAARLEASQDALHPWLVVAAEAYGLLAEAAGAHAEPVTDPPGLRRLLSEAYQAMAIVVADPQRPIAAVLDSGQLDLLLAALDDAAAWRGHRATSACQDCADSPAELCEEHGADLDRIDQYLALFREFEPIEIPESFRLTGGLL
jgi:hypothetical protein